MSDQDLRLHIFELGHYDPRINFVCLDYPSFVDAVDIFPHKSVSRIHKVLEQITSEVINYRVIID